MPCIAANAAFRPIFEAAQEDVVPRRQADAFYVQAEAALTPDSFSASCFSPAPYSVCQHAGIRGWPEPPAPRNPAQRGRARRYSGSAAQPQCMRRGCCAPRSAYALTHLLALALNKILAVSSFS